MDQTTSVLCMRRRGKVVRQQRWAAFAFELMLFDGDGKLDFDRRGPEAHLVAASLITQFAGHGCRTGGGIGGRGEVRADVEGAGEDEKVFISYLNLFGLGEGETLRFERAINPGQFERDEVLVFRMIAVDVEARENFDLEVLDSRGAALDRDGARIAHRQLILLRQQ